MSDGNKNIVHIESIENYAIAMKDLLGEIKAKTPTECAAVWEATEFLKMYQANQIKALRDEFE